MQETTLTTDIVIVGAGAAGYFAAANCPKNQGVILLEGTKRPLTKVKISGGGRCNVTHNIMDPRLLVKGYPRGSKQLLSPLSKFGPKETIAWYEERGVKLKAENDGRMFPITNSSQTIIDCLEKERETCGAKIVTGFIVKKIERAEDYFLLYSQKDEIIKTKKILLATGSAPKGWDIAQSLGHTIVPPVPSLFTFEISHPLLSEMMGISFKDATIRFAGFKEQGSLLITHWGLSGPLVLKLSAFAARTLHAADYKQEIIVSWINVSQSDAVKEIEDAVRQYPRVAVSKQPLFNLPKRFWQNLITLLAIDKNFAELSRKDQNKLCDYLLNCKLQIAGKGEFKEEFVTAGGISLDEVNFKTMESKKVPGLYFAGEILDIDGVTGGFNFQNAWATAFTAIQAMANEGKEAISAIDPELT